jgi:hypothetical protein
VVSFKPGVPRRDVPYIDAEADRGDH